jgi:hypothetical protein
VAFLFYNQKIYIYFTLLLTGKTNQVMKKNAVTILTLLFTFVAFAQQQAVPDFKNSPMVIGPDGTLVKLEKKSVEIKAKAKAMGYGGVSMFLNIDGQKSPVRVGSGSTFIIKVEADVDPETVFYLTPTKIVGKTREVEISRTSAFAAYGAKGKSVKKDDITLEFEKVTDGVYKMKPTQPLVAGTEYAFVSTAQGASGQQSVVFLFGTE